MTMHRFLALAALVSLLTLNAIAHTDEGGGVAAESVVFVRQGDL